MRTVGVSIYTDGASRAASVHVDLLFDQLWSLAWGGVSGPNWKCVKFHDNTHTLLPRYDHAGVEVESQGHWAGLDDFILALRPWLELEYENLTEAMLAETVLRDVLIHAQKSADARPGRVGVMGAGLDLFVDRV